MMMETNANLSPSLQTQDYVRAALISDHGQYAELVSWTIDSFTDDGDNCASDVKEIKIEFNLNGQKREQCYIMKSNKGDTEELFPEMSQVDFTTEAVFYTEIIPKVNSVLSDCRMELLKVPKCLFVSLEKEEELIILENLRLSNYKMNDRMTSLNASQTNLVLQELARLHASSYIFQERSPEVQLEGQYIGALTEDERFKPFRNEMFSIYTENALSILQEFGGYEKAEEWIRLNRSNLANIYDENLESTPPFQVVCHGDCWNNNFLFRYGENGEPVDVRFIDFQGCRKATLASDILELMYTSVDGLTRKHHRDSFLETYYESFSRVLKVAGSSMPFTLQELQEEYQKRFEIGLIMGLVTIPWMISDEGLQFYEGNPDDNEQLGSFKRDLKAKTLELLESHPVLKQRFFSLFDELIDA